MSQIDIPAQYRYDNYRPKITIDKNTEEAYSLLDEVYDDITERAMRKLIIEIADDFNLKRQLLRTVNVVYVDGIIK